MRWNYTPVHAESVAALARSLGTPGVVAELLLVGECPRPARARCPRAGPWRGIADPFLLVNLGAGRRAACDEAIDRREKLVILGDYDVDGVVQHHDPGRSLTTARAGSRLYRAPPG